MTRSRESYLEQQHEVSRQTVRRAMAQLREEGLIYTLPQRGSFVASARRATS